MASRLLPAAVSAAVLLSGCARAPEAASPIVRLAPACARERIHLTFVGDSLARGWGASATKDTFASIVYADVRRSHPKTTMRNFGRVGATTDEIAATEVSLLDDDGCSLVVIVSGANDVQKLYTPGHFGKSYAKLLKTIRARVPDAGLVVIGLPDVSLSPRIPWILKPIESWLSRNDNVSIAASAQRFGAAFVPLYALSHSEAFRANSLLSRDGIHPNDAGYRIMAATALPSVMMMFQPTREGRP